MPKRIKIEIVWDMPGSELTFLEHVTLPEKVTQREFLEFCIETTERAKKLGRNEQDKPLPRPSELDEVRP